MVYKRLIIAVALICAAIEYSSAASGFYISQGQLYDANDQQFLIRGINHAHAWYTSRTSSFADIKSLGANTVRVVLSSGNQYAKSEAADVANVVSLCKTNMLVCVLEVHDTTGYGESGSAVTLSTAVSYWTSIKSTLQGQEKYILLNIGNEPYGNNNVGNWKDDTKSAIIAMRNAGFTHTLVVDAPNWGQDWSNTMQAAATEVFTSDTAANTILSVHMYEVYDTPQKVSDYLGPFLTAKVPVIVGEYGNYHNSHDVDEDAIMSYSLTNGVGILAWSWCGNSGGVEYLDLVTNWDKSQLTTWGQRTFTGTNGISSTAVEASVYSGALPSLSKGRVLINSAGIIVPNSAPPGSAPPGSSTPSSANAVSTALPGLVVLLALVSFLLF